MTTQLDYHTLYKIFDAFKMQNPSPKGELHYTNPYTLLVAVTLSAQATDSGVNKATQHLFARVQTPQEMLELGETALIEHIKTIGLYRGKTKNILACAQILVDLYAGAVPQSRAALIQLPGVGRKTANVVLNIAFHQPAQAVDTHVFRIANRSGIAPGKDVRAVEIAIEENIPACFQQNAHHWLILHGRYVCKARNPLCHACIICEFCTFEQKPIPTTKTGHHD